MAKLDKETLSELTALCCIECTEEEQTSLLSDLQQMLDYVAQLEQINTENVPPCHHVLQEVASVMREDKTGDLLDRELFLANAPSHIGGMVRVPLIIKQR